MTSKCRSRWSDRPSQATTSTFWKDTNGAAEGVITDTAAAPDVALSPSTIPFAEAYIKKHGVTPAYVGYTSYDMVHVIAEAIERAGGSTDPTTIAIQWQNGKQTCVWPADKCNAKITFPSFVKTPS